MSCDAQLDLRLSIGCIRISSAVWPGRSVYFGAELGEDRLDREVLFCLLTSTLRLGTGIHGLRPCALQLLFEGSAGSASGNFGWSTAFI